MSKTASFTMHRFRDARDGEAVPSFIAPDLVIRGQVFGPGEVVVSGRIDGTVSTATTTVLADGLITGQVVSERLRVEPHGRVEGVIDVRCLGIKADARIEAAIRTRQPVSLAVPTATDTPGDRASDKAAALSGAASRGAALVPQPAE